MRAMMFPTHSVLFPVYNTAAAIHKLPVNSIATNSIATNSIATNSIATPSSTIAAAGGIISVDNRDSVLSSSLPSSTIAAGSVSVDNGDSVLSSSPPSSTIVAGGSSGGNGGSVASSTIAGGSGGNGDGNSAVEILWYFCALFLLFAIVWKIISIHEKLIDNQERKITIQEKLIDNQQNLIDNHQEKTIKPLSAPSLPITRARLRFSELIAIGSVSGITTVLFVVACAWYAGGCKWLHTIYIYML